MFQSFCFKYVLHASSKKAPVACDVCSDADIHLFAEYYGTSTIIDTAELFSASITNADVLLKILQRSKLAQIATVDLVVIRSVRILLSFISICY